MLNFQDFCWLNFTQPILGAANLQPKETGLKTIVHVMSKGGAKYGARIKVSNIAGTFHHKDNFTITNEHEPRIIGNCKLKSEKEHVDDIIDWVKLNQEHINKVWNNGDTMTMEEVSKGFKTL